MSETLSLFYMLLVVKHNGPCIQSSSFNKVSLELPPRRTSFRPSSFCRGVVRDLNMSKGAEEVNRLTESTYKNVMDQFNPGLRNLVNLGKNYEKSVAAMTLAGKLYFDAMSKIGENAAVSPVSRELGVVLMEISEVHRKVHLELEENFKRFHREIIAELERKTDMDVKYMTATYKRYQMEHKMKQDSLERSQSDLKKLRRKSQGKNANKYENRESEKTAFGEMGLHVLQEVRLRSFWVSRGVFFLCLISALIVRGWFPSSYCLALSEPLMNDNSVSVAPYRSRSVVDLHHQDTETDEATMVLPPADYSDRSQRNAVKNSAVTTNNNHQHSPTPSAASSSSSDHNTAAQPNGISRPAAAYLAGGNPFATVRLRPTVTNDRSAPVI
ncbi:hypothetical protein F2P81_014928 [Scophthalmus maximus]|uniref:IMD domain-containing protein n=1 Tax=Scophthalmus maximus TaxID=52904 RepID=A0A6A4SKE7_SCOMX|nr:hypothetical protein F2P81_014928 [Scophthalmus maximus]